MPEPVAPHTVVIAHKGKIDHYPVVTSTAVSLARHGYAVHVLCYGADKQLESHLLREGVVLHPAGGDSGPGHKFLTRGISLLRFRRHFWRLHRRIHPHLCWVSGVPTGVALGARLRGIPYILQCHELHDREARYFRRMALYLHGAARVVVPEINRAHVLRSWFGLSKTPFVIPNAPLFHPRTRQQMIADPTARTALSALPHDARLVLYQGALRKERNLVGIAQAVHAMGAPWRFVVMGWKRGAILDELRQSCPDLLWIPPQSSPFHLQVTSHAHIGVIAYSHDCLNSVFCAPNKVWEYAGFGIPALAQNLPGLTMLYEQSGAGLCVDTYDVEAIRLGLARLEAERATFQNKAQVLFETAAIEDNVMQIYREATDCTGASTAV